MNERRARDSCSFLALKVKKNNEFAKVVAKKPRIDEDENSTRYFGSSHVCTFLPIALSIRTTLGSNIMFEAGSTLRCLL